jgi:hypothetical protein
MKDFITNNWPYIIGGYETLTRLVPTTGKNYSLVHKIFSILGKVINGAKIVSDFLNREKPYKTPGAGLVLVLVVLMASCKSVQKIECGHSYNVPVTFHNLTTGVFYTVNVPFCDTVNVTEAPAKPKQ